MYAFYMQFKCYTHFHMIIYIHIIHSYFMLEIYTCCASAPHLNAVVIFD